MPLLVVAYCVIPSGDGMNIRLKMTLKAIPQSAYPDESRFHAKKTLFKYIYIEKAELLMGFHGIHI
jgi:hypothetical protein